MKIREFKQGQKVTVRHTILDSRSGNIAPGKTGYVVKIVDGYSPANDEYDANTISIRDGRGHTQLVRVRFSRKRIKTVSGWYLRNKKG